MAARSYAEEAETRGSMCKIEQSVKVKSQKNKDSQNPKYLKELCWRSFVRKLSEFLDLKKKKMKEWIIIY